MSLSQLDVLFIFFFTTMPFGRKLPAVSNSANVKNSLSGRYWKSEFGSWERSSYLVAIDKTTFKTWCYRGRYFFILFIYLLLSLQWLDIISNFAKIIHTAYANSITQSTPHLFHRSNLTLYKTLVNYWLQRKSPYTLGIFETNFYTRGINVNTPLSLGD